MMRGRVKMKASEKRINNGACPTDEAFIEAFLNRSGPAAKEKLVDHALSCGICSKKFDILRQLSAELKKNPAFQDKKGHHKAYADALQKEANRILNETESLRSDFKPRRRARKFLIPVSAVLILIAAGAFFYLTFFHSETFRAQNSTQLILLEPLKRIQSPPSVFKWKPVMNAEIYSLRIIDEYLNTVHATGALVSHYPLPEEIRMKLEKGVAYMWIVKAFDDLNRQISEAKGYFVIEE